MEALHLYLTTHNISYDFSSIVAKAKMADTEIEAIAVALDTIISIAKSDHCLDPLDLVMVSPIPAFVKVSISNAFLDCNFDGCNKLAYIISLVTHYRNPSFAAVGERVFALETIAVAKMIVGTLLEVSALIVTPGSLPDNVFISDKFIIDGESIFAIVIGSEVNIFNLSDIDTLNVGVAENANVPPSYIIPRTVFLSNLVTTAKLITAVQLNIQLPSDSVASDTTLPTYPQNLYNTLNVLQGTVDIHPSSGSSPSAGSELHTTLTFYPNGSSSTSGLLYGNGCIYTLNTPIAVSDSLPGATAVDEQTATNLRDPSTNCKHSSTSQMFFTVDLIQSQVL